MREPLVIGVGNTLRGDDGVAAQLLSSWHDAPDVLLVPQLTIDLAPIIEQHPAVLIVDAAVCLAPGEWTLEKVRGCASTHSAFGHELNPGELIAVTEALFGAIVDVDLLCIGAQQFDSADTLSPAVTQVLPDVLDTVREWWAARADVQPETTTLLES